MHKMKGHASTRPQRRHLQILAQRTAPTCMQLSRSLPAWRSITKVQDPLQTRMRLLNCHRQFRLSSRTRSSLYAPLFALGVA